LLVVAASRRASADEPSTTAATPSAEDAADPPPLNHARPSRPRDHLEVTMGFLGGQRAYDGLAFSLDSGSPAGNIPGATRLSKPFTVAPYDTVNMVGLRYEARVHISYARMTAGFDLPFSTYRQSSAGRVYDVGGTQRNVSIDSLSAKECHFGLGLEVPFGPFVPFVDLLGGAHWVSTDLYIDGTHGSYSATGYAFTIRGGARLYMNRWFFAQVAGEAGIVGDLRWNAELSVGAALPW
jgi:hypothetical protein